MEIIMFLGVQPDYCEVCNYIIVSNLIFIIREHNNNENGYRLLL